jgi:hypothetical protein
MVKNTYNFKIVFVVVKMHQRLSFVTKLSFLTKLFQLNCVTSPSTCLCQYSSTDVDLLEMVIMNKIRENSIV